MTGVIRPPDYNYETNQGYRAEFAVGNDKPQVHGFIDSYMTESIFRWCNHSCDAICEFQDSRVGITHFCAVVVKEGKTLAYPAEVTIDYGDDHFKDIEACLCGSANYRKPPSAPRGKGKKISRNEPSKSKDVEKVPKPTSKKGKIEFEDDKMDLDEPEETRENKQPRKESGLRIP